MNIKGQGALEYLLLIGGAVLVAAIVIALVTGIPTGVSNPEDAIICAQNVTPEACEAETETTSGECMLRANNGLEYGTINEIPTGIEFIACVAAPV